MAINNPDDAYTLEERRLATPRLKLLTTVFIFLTLTGITAGVYASMVGHHFAYGVSREIPWGIVMAAFAFMANLATGLCLVAVIGHAYGATTLAPIGPRAGYLAIVAVVAAFMLLGLVVENPWRMLLFNATSPNLTSNIWWLTTLYGIMSGCLFLRFSLHVSNRRGWALGFGIIGAVAGVGANNNLGGLFTMAADPSIWYGFQLLVFFLVSAVMAGIAATILFTNFAYGIRKQKITAEMFKAMHHGGTILSLMLVILLVIIIARFSAMFFSDKPEPGLTAALALLKGPLAFNFWVLEILVGIILPLVILAATRFNNLGAMSIAAGLALIGAIFQRIDLVLSGQIIPKFSGWQTTPQYLHYFPTFVEILVVAGGFALLGAGFLLGERFVGRVFRYY
jgi:Ni/Fe-hydrogenase subunit HybB-like protein